MEDTKLCCSCGDEYPCRSQNPNQNFCCKQACQNDRNRLWKVEKRKDPSYRETERTTQKKWRGNNSHYMGDYRRKNPEYVEMNREQQRVRNALRGGRSATKEGKSERSRQRATNATKQKPPGLNKNEGAVIVKSNASNTLAAKAFLDEILATCDTVIVKSNASSSSEPMVLVPLSMLTGIVKATRQGAYQLE